MVTRVDVYNRFQSQNNKILRILKRKPPELTVADSDKKKQKKHIYLVDCFEEEDFRSKGDETIFCFPVPVAADLDIFCVEISVKTNIFFSGRCEKKICILHGIY